MEKNKYELGNAKEVSEDKHAHWGNVVAAYDPVMGKTENCIDQLNSIGINPSSIRYVLHSHLHLDHSGGVGRFPNATHVVQQKNMTMLLTQIGSQNLPIDKNDDYYDLYGDGSIIIIFTPGHAPGHQSF